MNTYIYKLGHIPELGRAELAALCGTTYQDIEILKGFAFSERKILANTTGSLVWSGRVFNSFQYDANVDPQELLTTVSSHIENELSSMKLEGIKRLGLVLPQSLSIYNSEIIRLIKNAGFKGVQLVFGLNNFGFGHYRAVKNWILACSLETEMLLVRLLDMSNQEFWSNLDMRLPQRDMKRGIINLKLARSMLNLSGNTKIWDPFVGQGRVMAAGMDIASEFIASDIDDKCLPECTENIEYAGRFWQKYGKRITGVDKNAANELTNSEANFCELVDVFPLDAAHLSSISQNVSRYSLVTEGYLGPTLSEHAEIEEAKKYLNEITELWLTVIPQAIKLGMKSVLFCLPYYSVLPFKTYQNVLNQFTSIPKVKFVSLSSTGFIVYNREKTRVGHAIFQLNF